MTSSNRALVQRLCHHITQLSPEPRQKVYPRKFFRKKAHVPTNYNKEFDSRGFHIGDAWSFFLTSASKFNIEPNGEIFDVRPENDCASLNVKTPSGSTCVFAFGKKLREMDAVLA